MKFKSFFGHLKICTSSVSNAEGSSCHCSWLAGFFCSWVAAKSLYIKSAVSYLYEILEIKTFGLVVEFKMWHCTVGWTKHWSKVPKRALTAFITMLVEKKMMFSLEVMMSISTRTKLRPWDARFLGNEKTCAAQICATFVT